MSEQTYNKVFELIQGTLVPKTQLEEAQMAIENLKAMLKKTTTELEKTRSESNEQKLSMEIIQAEKESLQAEKKTIEVKFNEVSLKLKQKTNQYDSLLKSQIYHALNSDKNSPGTSTGNKKIKEEPRGIGVVNVPASTSSRPDKPAAKTGTKRQNVSKNDSQSNSVNAKRKKTQNTKESIRKKFVLTCKECLYEWGKDIESNFQEDPDHDDAPDPKQKIQTFSSFKVYEAHLWIAHQRKLRQRLISNHLIQISDDLKADSDDSDSDSEDLKAAHYFYPNSKFACKICYCSFAFQHNLEDHVELEHANLNMTNQQFFDLYYKM